MEPYLGVIVRFGGNFAMMGYAFCDGQLLPIAAYDAVYALIGTIYGGDGQTTFGLPDLRGRVPIGTGGQYVLGQSAGTNQETLTSNTMPPHTHQLRCTTQPGNSASPGGCIMAMEASGGVAAYSSSGPTTTMRANVISVSSGASQPHENRQPYLACSYQICLEGIFPSRS